MDPQEEQIRAGKDVTSSDFGVGPPGTQGLLTTVKEIHSSQTYDEAHKKYSGYFPSIKGQHVEYYKDLVAALRGQKDLVVKPEQSRDGIRAIELARESHNTSRAVKWSEFD